MAEIRCHILLIVRMTFDDFVDNFTDVSICHMLTTHFFALKNHYNEESFTGLWNFSTDPLANRAGGCTNFKSTFLQNPQVCTLCISIL